MWNDGQDRGFEWAIDVQGAEITNTKSMIADLDRQREDLLIDLEILESELREMKERRVIARLCEDVNRTGVEQNVSIP